MTTLEFLNECEEMALHNILVYAEKEKYEKEHQRELEKLAIINTLKVQLTMNKLKNFEIKGDE